MTNRNIVYKVPLEIIFLILILCAFTGPVRSQEFGPWSHWDVDHTMCPRSWPSVINPLPWQNGYQMKAVETYKWDHRDNDYVLSYSDSCWWPTNDSVLIFRKSLYASRSMSFIQTPEKQNFHDYNGFPYRMVERDRYGRDSIVTVCTEYCGEIIFRITQLAYNENGEIISQLIKTRGEENSGEFHLDSIAYSYSRSDGRIIRESQRHYLDENYLDSVLYFYEQDRLIEKITYRTKDQTVKYSFCNYSYFSDSLAHKLEVEGVFNLMTGRPDTTCITDRGYNREGRLCFQRDIPSYYYTNYTRLYFFNYNDQGLITEWVFLEGDQNPVPNRKIVFHWFDKTAGTENWASDYKPLIYPNPANQVLTIDFRKNGPATVSVFDLKGKLVFSRNFSTLMDAIDMDISTLEEGVYFLQIHDKDRPFSYRFIKSSQ